MNSESNSVEALRNTAGKGMLILLWLHLPLSLAISLARGMDWIMPASLMTVLAIAATLSWRISGSGVSTRCTVAVALMGGVSLLVYQMSGHPWQIDMHMYFFATLACLAAYCDFRPILIGAGAVALHHLTLNFLYPAAVYPGGGDFSRVVVHAVILVFEAAILVWLPYKLAQMFDIMAEKSAEAEAAKAAQQQATAERAEAEHQAKQERDANWLTASNRRSDRSLQRSRSPPARCKERRRPWMRPRAKQRARLASSPQPRRSRPKTWPASPTQQTN
jgi:methyl-accepting chemotaxis protein